MWRDRTHTHKKKLRAPTKGSYVFHSTFYRVLFSSIFQNDKVKKNKFNEDTTHNEWYRSGRDRRARARERKRSNNRKNWRNYLRQHICICNLTFNSNFNRCRSSTNILTERSEHQPFFTLGPKARETETNERKQNWKALNIQTINFRWSHRVDRSVFLAWFL